MKFEIENLDSLPEVVGRFLEYSKKHKHYAVFGSMGVGKTTFIKEVCKQLHVNEVVTSPTFALVNEYTITGGDKVYHFDFYRINKEEELFDIGYEDYVYADAYCFIEWPEKAPDLIPDHFKKIWLKEGDFGKRLIEFDIN